MSVDAKENSRIPEAIAKTLEPKYTTVYHRHNDWVFDLSKLSSDQKEVVRDIQELFKSSQRWGVEAFATASGSATIGIGEIVVSTLSLSIVFHTKDSTPTISRGLLPGKTFLNIPEVIDDEVKKNSFWRDYSPWQEGLNHHMQMINYFHSIGPYGFEGNLEDTETSYFMSDLSLRPFLYFKSDGKNGLVFVGEDTSRMICTLTLQDGREVAIPKINENIKSLYTRIEKLHAKLADALKDTRYWRAKKRALEEHWKELGLLDQP